MLRKCKSKKVLWVAMAVSLLSLVLFQKFFNQAHAGEVIKNKQPKKEYSSVSTQPAQSSESYSGEDYKSYNPNIQFTTGFQTGFGLVNTTGGVAILGNAASRILKDGFVPDIVNPVYLEGEFGSLFAKGTNIWLYGMHLRWDFVRNSKWTYFAIGGVGGNFYDNKLGDQFAIHPRFGVGLFYASDLFDYRVQVSHEAITAGLSFPF